MNAYVQGFIQDLAQDYAIDKWNEYAEEKFQPIKDPFYETTASGKQRRRKLPEYCSKQEKKLWKKLQNRAWKDDRCLCGCLWVNWGLGLAPLLSIIPTIGPIIMYMVHSKLISMADKELALPADLLAKMHGNIVLDLLISLPPLLGTLLAWLNACSTRNCAMVYNFMAKRATEKHNRMKNHTYAYSPAQEPVQVQPAAPQNAYVQETKRPAGRPAPPPLAGVAPRHQGQKQTQYTTLPSRS